MYRCCVVTETLSDFKRLYLPVAEKIAQSDNEITLICKEETDIISSDFEFIPFEFENNIFSVINRLKKIFEENDFDIVEYFSGRIALPVAMAAASADVPVRIFNQGEVDYLTKSGASRFLLRLNEERIISNSTDVRQMSSEILENCINDGLYSDDVARVCGRGTMGVDLKQFDASKRFEYNAQARSELNIPEEAFVFGEICDDYGFCSGDELLEAFKAVGGGYLIILGTLQIDDIQLYRWAKSIENVIFIQQTDTPERYIAAMDCLVHPAYSCGAQCPVHQAAAMGVPAIVNDVAGVREYIEDKLSGLLAKPNDQTSLCVRMLQMSNDPDWLKEMSKNAYNNVCKYWDRDKITNTIIKDRSAILSELYSQNDNE